MVARTPLEGYLACCHALAEADLTHRIGALRLPILALVGAQDLATTPALVRATAAICSADYHEIQGAGHLPCVEAPQETARLIVQFVKEQHHV
jgi:3-oxoadipate enol-lactonase